MTHILWDWNGTLLDDTQAALDTLNIMLARRRGRPIEMGYYRDHFAFPVKPFYKAIGVCLENEDWDALAQEYHDTYAEQPKRLNPETFAALDYAKSMGCRQSIISALRQDLLDGITEELGVAKYMDFIYGVDNLDGFGKIDRARELVSAITHSSTHPLSHSSTHPLSHSSTHPLSHSSTHPLSHSSTIVLIGDSLHDKEVADALGVGCVLCGQGSHAAWRLAAVAPTGETLTDAVRMALYGKGGCA